MADAKISALPSATTPLDGTEVVPLVQSGATKKVAVSSLMAGPAFRAYQSSSQSLSSGAFTKLNLQTENFDTSSNFASSRFTPTVAGYYQFNWGMGLATTTQSLSVLYKNGAISTYGSYSTLMTESVGSDIVYLNGSTDYVELYGFQNSGVSQNVSANSSQTFLSGALIRSA
jgi:hypothetical protein